ncbi:transcriptional regulator with HTH domain and aminotransferase domain [Caldisphaera lagunensis DSM 15908]|uniref:Transcriptional regulator with HTH domain and aminotransferase domain n=1 Tax=Caldisphaera lagunensis (strain DSM 15908 / JCM 11604 / ANMR 0165 / IC-154) TaxID=1056495 RepID=L0ABK5_CALLD|nr:PLP-dependent aminotransferase family protein [Caldisphaera lagunensis]AFZ70430.1 transcriptional regulator with HTH domain and aminotransferase domain [Caldisphaera lagunensis DSM 15908]
MIDYSSRISYRSQSLRPSEIREILSLTEGKNIISLAGGLPGPEVFPKQQLADIAKRVLEDLGEEALQYSPTLGVTPFRNAIMSFASSKGIKVNEDDRVAVTTGSQEAIYLIGLSLIDPGDNIIVEAPTYLAALNAFRFFGANFISIPLDEDGMKVEMIENEIKKGIESGKKIKAIYTVATSHNPTGVIMNDERRKHLIEIANKYDLLIIEDDPYGFFVFDTDKRFTSLKTLDTEGRVIYMGTFSKILAPGLRLGYMIAPRQFTRTVELGKQIVDLHSSTLSQFIAMYAIKEGVVDETIENARKVYRKKRDVLIEALEEYMPKGSEWYKPKGGLFAFVYLPKGVDTTEMLPTAINKGVAYVPGRNFFADGSGGNAMRINFSYPSIDKLREGIKIIGETAKEMMK